MSFKESEYIFFNIFLFKIFIILINIFFKFFEDFELFLFIITILIIFIFFNIFILLKIFEYDVLLIFEDCEKIIDN